MQIHEILSAESPYLFKLLCKQYNLDEKCLSPSSGDKEDYYNFAREMVTDSNDQRLNYGR